MFYTWRHASHYTAIQASMHRYTRYLAPGRDSLLGCTLVHGAGSELGLDLSVLFSKNIG